MVSLCAALAAANFGAPLGTEDARQLLRLPLRPWLAEGSVLTAVEDSALEVGTMSCTSLLAIFSFLSVTSCNEGV